MLVGGPSVFLTSVYAVKLTLLWPDSDSDSDSDFAQVRVSVRVPDSTQSQSQSQVSLTFQESEILTRFYKWILGQKSKFLSMENNDFFRVFGAIYYRSFLPHAVFVIITYTLF